jgi:hypothetical protein
MIDLGAVIVVVMMAVRLAPATWREIVDAAGLAAFYGTLLLTGFPRIKNVKDSTVRAAARPAAIIAAAGAALATASVFLAFDSFTRWAERAGVVGVLLLLAAPVVFAVVSEVIRAVRILGSAAVLIGIALLAAAILLFSPVTVFLMTNGRWPAPLLGGPVEPGWADLMVMVPPAALLVGPMVLRQVLPWDKAAKTTQRLAPTWLAGVAVFFTCAYAMALHYVAANPLTGMSLSGLALAILFVGAFLWPLYKQIAKSSWRWGLADAVKLTDWRREQREAAKEVGDALRRAWRSARAASADQSNRSPGVPAGIPGPRRLDEATGAHESRPASATSGGTPPGPDPNAHA